MKHLSIIAITIIMLFTSCNRQGGEKSVFDYIPAESAGVARVNIDAILKNSGCRIRDGKVTLSPAMEYYLDTATPAQQEFFSSMVELYPLLEMQGIMAVENQGNIVGITGVRNPELMDKYLEEQGVETKIGSHTIYVTSSHAILTEDDIAVIGETPEQIAAVVDAAKKNPVTSISELTDLFADTEKTIIAYTRKEEKLSRRERKEGKQPGLTTQWLTMDLHEHSMDYELTSFDAEWNPVDLRGFIPAVDTEILQSVPAQAEAVIVMGESPDIHGFIELIQPSFINGFDEPSEMMFFTEFLKGSFVVSAAPAATGQFLRQLAPPAWNITATMMEPGDNLSTILSAISMMTPGSSIKNSKVDGQTRYQVTPELSLYIRQQDSLLTVSTDYIRDGRDTSNYASIFDGASFGVAVNVPYNSETMRAFNLPYGPNAVLIARDYTVTMHLSLNGSTSAFLEALAETLQAIR